MIYKYYYTQTGDIELKSSSKIGQENVIQLNTDLPYVISENDYRIDEYTVNIQTLELEKTKTRTTPPSR
jgi:hypothetical protein